MHGLKDGALIKSRRNSLSINSIPAGVLENQDMPGGGSI